MKAVCARLRESFGAASPPLLKFRRGKAAAAMPGLRK
jgi:hypothetical protein